MKAQPGVLPTIRVRGLIQIKSLLGDALATQMGYAHLNPGHRLMVVVPDGGPYGYLKDLWSMSSLAEEVIPLPGCSVATPEAEAECRLRAIQILRQRGCEDLLILRSEDYTVGDPEDFHRAWFPRIHLCESSWIHHYGAPEALTLSIPSEAKERAEAFLAVRGIREFVVVHNRESVWSAQMEAAGSRHSDDLWNGMRNHRIEPLVEAARSALPPEVHVVRVGSGGSPIPPRSRYHDTIPLNLDLPMQLALISRARCFIGGVSGPITFAWMLGTPLVIVNNPLMGCFLTRAGIPMVGLEKGIFLGGHQRSLAQVPLLEGGGAPARACEALGYELRENSQEEIQLAIQRMMMSLEQRQVGYWVHSRGEFHPLGSLLEEYTGCPCPEMAVGFPQIPMAFEQALSRLITPLMACVFQKFPNERQFRVGLYGAGRNGQKILEAFTQVVPWGFRFFDASSEKWGLRVGGVEVESPEGLVSDPPDLLILTTSFDETLLLENFRKLGWVRGENLFHWSDGSGTGPRVIRISPEWGRRVQSAALSILGDLRRHGGGHG